MEQTGYDPLVDGPFARAVHPRVDPAEGIRLLDQMLTHRLVVDRPQDAHVERDGVAHHAPSLETCAILPDERLGQCPEGEVLPLEINRQTVHRPAVVAGRTVMPAMLQKFDLPAHEVENRRFVGRLAEAARHLRHVEPGIGVFEPLRNPVQLRHVAFDAELDDRMRRRCRQRPARRFPLLLSEANRGPYALNAAPVGHLIIDASPTGGEGRFAEFYLYCSHNPFAK